MPNFQPGDHVKVEFSGSDSDQREWMWVEVDYVDNAAQILFGRLDNQPLVNSTLYLGEMLAIAYSKVLDHRKFPQSGSSESGRIDGSAKL